MLVGIWRTTSRPDWLTRKHAGAGRTGNGFSMALARLHGQVLAIVDESVRRRAPIAGEEVSSLMGGPRCNGFETARRKRRSCW